MSDVTARTPMPPSSAMGNGSRRSSQRRTSGGSGSPSVTATAAAAAAAGSSVSPVAAPSVQAAQAHSKDGGASVLADPRRVSLQQPLNESLPSGAFLTEAPWGAEAARPTPLPPPNRAGENEEDSEEDEMDAYQRRKRAQMHGEEQKEEQQDEEDTHAATATPDKSEEEEEEKSAPSLPSPSPSQALVMVRRHRRVASPKAASATVAKSPGGGGGAARKHLFPYAALFGSSRAKLAAARTARLAAIENSYERAMAERDLEVRHAQLSAQLAAEDAQRERDTRQALLAEQRRHAKLHAAKQRLEAQQRAVEASMTLRERQALVAERRRQEREHERAATEVQLRRLAELRTRALVDTHRSIDTRWADEEAEAVARFEADKEARVAGARSAKSASTTGSKKKNEQLGPVPAATLVPHPPHTNDGASSTNDPSAPAAAGAGGAPDSRGRAHARRLPPMPPSGGGGGGGAGPMQAPQLPSYGKGAPRRANPINSFSGGATRAQSFEEAVSSASSSRAGSPSRRSAPHTAPDIAAGAAAAGTGAPDSVRTLSPTPGGSVGATSRSSHLRMVGGPASVRQHRSPSSRYTLPRKHSTGGSDSDGDGAGTAFGGGTVGDSGAHPAAASSSFGHAATHSDDPPTSAAPLAPPPFLACPPVFSFWCSSLECAAALEPAWGGGAPSGVVVGLPATDGAEEDADHGAPPLEDEDARMVDTIAAQFRALFEPPPPPPPQQQQPPRPVSASVAGSAAAAARAAATANARCTLDDLLRGTSQPAKEARRSHR